MLRSFEQNCEIFEGDSEGSKEFRGFQETAGTN